MPDDERPKVISLRKKELADKDDVIFVLLWHLGDVLNATALLPELAAKHQRKLTFVTTRPCVQILANNPYLDKIVVLDVEIPKILSQQDFLRPQALANELFSSNACLYVCHFPIVLHKTERHLVEIWAQAFGIHRPLSQLKPTYFSTPNDQYQDGDDSIFVLGTGGQISRWSKNWPPNRWHEFVERFKSTFPNIHLVQLGTYEDALLDGVTDLRGKTTVDESYHILKHAKSCLTHDSFLAHLAAAAECPTFVIFGPTSPTHFRPLGHRDIFPLGGHRYYTRCARNLCVLTLGLAPCFAFPSVEEVFECVQRRIACPDVP